MSIPTIGPVVVAGDEQRRRRRVHDGLDVVRLGAGAVSRELGQEAPDGRDHLGVGDDDALDADRHGSPRHTGRRSVS